VQAACQLHVPSGCIVQKRGGAHATLAAERLRVCVEGCGGLITAEDVEVARECVRKARRAEQAERVAQGLSESAAYF
jgi:hypothetical protein